jgi:hypothetical protein
MPGWNAINTRLVTSRTAVRKHSFVIWIKECRSWFVSAATLWYGLTSKSCNEINWPFYRNGLAFLNNEVFRQQASVVSQSFGAMLTRKMLDISPVSATPQITHWANLSGSRIAQAASTVSDKLPAWTAYWLFWEIVAILHTVTCRGQQYLRTWVSNFAANFKADVMCWQPSI